MQVSKRDLYILVEGKPNSPEIAFFTQAIPKILIDNGLSNIEPNVVEVGGASSFNTFAQLGYRYSKLHQTIPVLAIADSDYKTSLSKQTENHSKLIAAQRPKIVYWGRHEWENYLLEETDLIVAWINQIPIKVGKVLPNRTQKCYRKSDKQAEQKMLEKALEQYFQNTIKVEYWECLKFNLAVQIKEYPAITKPADFENLTLTEIEEWFFSSASKSEAVIKLKKKPEKLFEEIMKSLPWEKWLNQPLMIQFDVAKKRFRGKEAFNHLCQWIEKEFSIHKFDKNALIREILKNLATNASSALFIDLQDLLLSELGYYHTVNSHL